MAQSNRLKKPHPLMTSILNAIDLCHGSKSFGRTKIVWNDAGGKSIVRATSSNCRRIRVNEGAIEAFQQACSNGNLNSKWWRRLSATGPKSFRGIVVPIYRWTMTTMNSTRCGGCGGTRIIQTGGEDSASRIPESEECHHRGSEKSTVSSIVGSGSVGVPEASRYEL